MLDFLEKTRMYSYLFGFSDYDGSLAVNTENTAKIMEQLAARKPFFARAQIMNSALDLLESEEGQWIAKQRRLLWLGVLLDLIKEIETQQPALKQQLIERTKVSTNEIIRIYGEELTH